MNVSPTITISQRTFDSLSRRAAQNRRKVDDLAEEILQTQIQPTDHPYIIRREGFRGGKPILRGSNMAVWLIVAMWKSGDTADEILIAYPHLQPAAVYDAISYYFDHREEIEAQISENKIERVLKNSSATMTDAGEIRFDNG
ncbi:MAG TPA: DUF433 domain-containing protein [Anaerolineales bacterium]|nr:DUF433 domain-containing protein [Anaerolineales bacterium]